MKEFASLEVGILVVVVVVQAGINNDYEQPAAGDEFNGFFTRFHFPTRLCIKALTLDSLSPLTGVDDMYPIPITSRVRLAANSSIPPVMVGVGNDGV